MPMSHDFFIRGEPEVGKTTVARALEGERFTITRTPSGGLLAQRGSTVATLLLAALAGNNLHMSFLVEFMTHQDGNLVARLNRSATSGFVKGGALGAAATTKAFHQCVQAIGHALTTAGAFAGETSNA